MADWGHRKIVEHYEACLARHGDSHLGVDWPRKVDAERRYDVMLGLIRPEHHAQDESVSLLDFGCGAGHLFEHLTRRGVGQIRYTGLDLSEQFVSLCRGKHPEVDFLCADILNDSSVAALPGFDYIVANGVFTEKRELSFDAMLEYFSATILRLFSLTGVGLAFNLMSTQVDWERDDLFHVPLDTVANILAKNLSRHFIVRNDYGLYEYSVYVYREPTAWPRLLSSV